MRSTRGVTLVLLLISITTLACSLLTPTRATPPTALPTNVAPTSEPGPQPTAAPSAESNVAPSPEPATAVPTAVPTIPPSPTTPRLELEIVQSQTWPDSLGNTRSNVLFRNPYDFPVSLGPRPRATLRNGAGDPMRDGNLYFLDGISGGGGFLLPGELIAANTCYTCEEALLTEDWVSVEFVTSIEDATGMWAYSTEVEPSVGAVTFDGDSPLFDVNGTVTNNSATLLQRISVRIVVFDEAGNLIGAAEASAWDVGAGATANFNSYGIGQTPAGPFTYEVTALGVNY